MSDTDDEFGYSCHGCGLQSFQISMEGYRVDRAKCNRCGTVVHFKDTSQSKETAQNGAESTSDERDARYRNPPQYHGVEAAPGMEDDS